MAMLMLILMKMTWLKMVCRIVMFHPIPCACALYCYINDDVDVDEDGLVEDGLQDSVISRRLAAPPPWWTLRERRGDALPAQSVSPREAHRAQLRARCTFLKQIVNKSPPGRRNVHNYVHVAHS